jgi:hypothetical protein
MEKDCITNLAGGFRNIPPRFGVDVIIVHKIFSLGKMAILTRIAAIVQKDDHNTFFVENGAKKKINLYDCFIKLSLGNSFGRNFRIKLKLGFKVNVNL